MKGVFLLLILFSYTNSVFGQTGEFQSVDDIFSEWNKENVPGGSIGIIKDGEFIYTKGYGMANLEYDIPNSASSVFRIASTSKQFTAACIVLLAEKGKLSLDDNLKSIFPDFPAYANEITIRNMLNHTSGIRDYLQLAYLKGLRDDDHYVDEDLMGWLINQTDLNFSPGEEYLYSNSGYWLLGQIVEKISGVNMAAFARKEIFEPLGMMQTHFHNDHTQIVKERASGYVPGNDGEYKISMTTLNMIGDGGIFTSINDMKKWDDAYYERSILSNEFWEMMTTQGVLNEGEIIDYASGLDIGEYNGLKTISHGGAFVGYRAEFMRFPEQKVSIAIFANRGDVNPTNLAYQVADVILKNDFIETENVIVNEESVSQEFIQLNANELKKFEGDYWNDAGSYSRKIYVKNDTLRYYRSEYSESDLLPISENEFKMVNVGADLTIKFTDEQSHKLMTVVIDEGNPIISKSFTPKNYTIAELAAFEGNYYSEELDATYSFKLENESLRLFINDKASSSLRPIMTNKFSNDDYGVFEFMREDNEKLSGFRLASGRVKNLVFKRE